MSRLSCAFFCRTSRNSILSFCARFFVSARFFRIPFASFCVKQTGEAEDGVFDFLAIAGAQSIVDHTIIEVVTVAKILMVAVEKINTCTPQARGPEKNPEVNHLKTPTSTVVMT